MEKVQATKIREEITEKPFSSGDVWEDLDDWSRKLGALGKMISALAWHEKDGGSESLCSEGELLGGIIYDYAQAIRLTMDQEHELLGDFDQSIVFPLARHQSAYGLMTLTTDLNETDIPGINKHLKALHAFTNKAINPVLEMTIGLENIRKEIIENSTKQKEASTTETTAAEA